MQIKDDLGLWHDQHDAIAQTFVASFKKRFTNPCDIATTDINNFLQVIIPSISATDNVTLLLPVALEQNHVVLNSIGPLKAPGPDGHALFFQRFWPQVHPILFYLVQDFFLNAWYAFEYN